MDVAPTTQSGRRRRLPKDLGPPPVTRSQKRKRALSPIHPPAPSNQAVIGPPSKRSKSEHAPLSPIHDAGADLGIAVELEGRPVGAHPCVTAGTTNPTINQSPSDGKSNCIRISLLVYYYLKYRVPFASSSWY